MIKICPNPNCSEVYHNCKVTDKKCKNCGCRIMKINNETYRKKFSWLYWQYDYQTGQLYRPDTKIVNNQLSLFTSEENFEATITED
jgi:hypothetical protein